MIIADTGFVVALLNHLDKFHSQAISIYENQEEYYIALPQTVLAEVAFMVGKAQGILIIANFLKNLPESRFKLMALNKTDIVRVGEILEEYADTRIDFVDATVMAMAERLNFTTILTVDQRDFRIFRPRHCNYFTLLPDRGGQ